ncbi:GNAT family N-acetyltransferase [Flavobacterium sp. MAH-1]|uniref:GNAT family N-acetyltransferase n=1 Tax=Flavobacterium agri TaxID=2743471 RepID=A0A7Y8Y1T8_9FLAO|nr:GNAT family N-acetyltransferase [Flavobacterium agri]NUY79610.1 GNAT family N-acetyltransferase [Flavobacterium agri]NYA69635.1 GNAT family N-acetyltransferase [Flavobacterium agri]
MNKESKPFPILTSERLTLRQLSQTDAERILQLRSDPEINKFLDRKPSKTLQDASTFIQSIIENGGDGLFYWAITRIGDEKLIGTICLFEFSNDGKKCEIGYELLTEYQGHGFMIEAAQKIIGFAGKTLGLKTVDTVTHKDNKSSTGLLLKLGFEELEDSDVGNRDLIVFRLAR